MSTSPVLRSTRVRAQSLLPEPATVSASRRPALPRASTSAGQPPDHALAGESAAAVVGTVAITPSLARPAEVGVKGDAFFPVAPYVTVYRLVADGELSEAEQAARDLHGAPLPTQ